MRILIIEDDVAITDLVTMQLNAQDYVVEAVHDGPRGFERARHGHHDALLIDLLLPGYDGYEVIMRLRQEGVRTPILVLSGLTAIEDIVRALDAGADDYLVKPYRFEELSARLRAIQRRGGSRPPDTIECGPLRYDRSQRAVTMLHEPIELTGKEFELLEQLLLANGRIVRRADLHATLWDQGPGASNVLDVHVGNIRRKLARKSDRVRLDTIRGVGFRLYALSDRVRHPAEDPETDPLVEPQQDE